MAGFQNYGQKMTTKTSRQMHLSASSSRFHSSLNYFAIFQDTSTMGGVRYLNLILIKNIID
ncbi:hypothetical protein BpHYR1_016218 [Brachionus plicatilis]|uniref:Uncharacterized protein n=1 Tax=Brachionus plicatilis TaxID=10195 RepID=A0A3M7QLD2_BRAPC|nr:hypothetical protein BpHYR1_016218 [Brachionus plicatilis]